MGRAASGREVNRGLDVRAQDRGQPLAPNPEGDSSPGWKMGRQSGLLLHITSLPSPFGIGDLGPGAYRFADFLAQARQGLWQILPLKPTRPALGNSPYSSPSAFAGNPLLISPEILFREGWLSRSDLRPASTLPPGRVDYPRAVEGKRVLLERAFFRFTSREDGRFLRFCEENSHWLEDYALYTALHEHLGGAVWSEWPPELRDRKERALARWRELLRERVENEKFRQYAFSSQWLSLKDYCRRLGIRIIGDLPIYVNYDSADTWSHPQLFKLDARRRPQGVAGIPPDYFSKTGQLWGNPIYRWPAIKRDGYSWWMRRLAHELSYVDILRLDHFKGFVEFWEVPAGQPTAVHGRWVKGPREDFFRALKRRFTQPPFIAEDLGVITPEVQALRDRFGLPGMRVLQFAFGSDPLAAAYTPVHYIPHCVAYTGTHDNNTLLGWLFSSDHTTRRPEEVRAERRKALNYLGWCRGRRRKEVPWGFIQLLMMSAAEWVIFPVQDLLGLGEEARMNVPGTAEGNWEWRLKPGQLALPLARRLALMTGMYGREKN